ncbi:hypothetical protein GGC64_002146 [Mycobacterium sp. OAS707]|uniref:DUF262 domain-containing protein n=1 Tax=Mycobacterium sp. OAS707 TaxID=2663822 RepID=UPI001788E913|nr:DUF262 domain-containing protein [Mycobacterium sp. OAS707]MBE1548138.1 hypothetical protein [Mycobacterium sp. OAS707]
MQSDLEIWTVLTVFQRRFVIDPKPGYQRSAVWDRRKQQLLIDSILRGYDIPKFYLRYVKNRDPFEYEVVDGQQRLRAIWSFLSDELEVGEFDAAIELPDGIVGRTFSELSAELQEQIGLFRLVFSVLETDTPQEEVQELFLRLQEGVSLNPAERRNAMVGPVRDFVAGLAEEHPLFPQLGITEKRFLWHELVAIALRLEQADGPTDLKSAPLYRMYRDVEFKPNGHVAEAVRRNLDLFASIARLRRGSFKTRWGFVDLYLAARRLARDGINVEQVTEDVLDHHVSFEDERLQAAGALEDALSQSDGEYDLGDMDRYVLAFRREGATKDNVARRHEIYYGRLRKYLQARAESELPILEP